MNLTYKQRLFVSYFTGASAGNGTDAARRAGFACPAKAAAKLVAKGSIRAAIEAKVTAVAMSQDEILARLTEIACADLLEFVEGDSIADIRVNLRRARRRGTGHLLRRLKTAKGELEVEVKDSMAAMTLIGKYYGMWDREAPPEVSLVEFARRLKERAKAKGGSQP